MKESLAKTVVQNRENVLSAEASIITKRNVQLGTRHAINVERKDIFLQYAKIPQIDQEADLQKGKTVCQK